MSVVESAEMMPLPPSPGKVTPVKAELDTMLQLVPSQCSTKAFADWELFPMAQALFDAGAVTAFRSLPVGIVGLGTSLQLEPFQCSIRVALLVPPEPTAHTSLLAAAATLLKAELLVGAGVLTTRQPVPSKCSASGA
jgi:hypothetical protein